MTDKEKREKLKLLDELYLDLLIEQLQNGLLDVRDASQVKDYLKANQIVAEKESSSLEDEVAKKVREAELRRQESAKK